MVAARIEQNPPQSAPLYFSRVAGKPILDAHGERVARIDDVMIRFGSAPHPLVSGVVARQGRRRFYLGWDKVATLDETGVRLSTFTIDVRQFARRDGEVLLKRDILDKQLIDVDGRRVIRANDLLLSRVDDVVRLAGVDVSAQALWRRLGPQSVTAQVMGTQIIDWAVIESFATDIPMVRLKVSHRGVSRLHPFEIAQIVEDLSPRQQQELLESLDDETAADTVQELDPDDAADLLELLDPERAADILEEMEPEDAADVLAEMDEEESEQLLHLMEREDSDDVRELMAYANEYEHDTAAGLMTTEFITVAPTLSAAEALSGLRAVPEPPDVMNHVYLATEEDGEGRQQLLGVVALRDLVLAAPTTPLLNLAAEHVRTVPPNTLVRDVAQMMVEYNLTTVPVVDDNGTILGVVHVDDAMEIFLPDANHEGLTERFVD